jgi:hypothetical protein
MTHTFDGQSMPDANAVTIAEELSGAEYDGYPIVLASATTIHKCGVDGGIHQLVWPHEGEFNAKGGFKFHKGKIMDGKTEIDAPKAPMLLDGSSARAFMLVYDSINEANKLKTEEYTNSRGLFVWFMETIVWPNCSFGGRG